MSKVRAATSRAALRSTQRWAVPDPLPNLLARVHPVTSQAMRVRRQCRNVKRSVLLDHHSDSKHSDDNRTARSAKSGKSSRPPTGRSSAKSGKSNRPSTERSSAKSRHDSDDSSLHSGSRHSSRGSERSGSSKSRGVSK